MGHPIRPSFRRHLATATAVWACVGLIASPALAGHAGPRPIGPDAVALPAEVEVEVEAVVAPSASPVAVPVASTVASPVVSPVASPAASPVASPVASPAASPVVSPVVSPVASPAAVGTGLMATDVMVVMNGLIASGTAPERAAEQVVALTAEDLALLASHPAMLQPAGAMDAQTTNLLLGLAVLGGIIALAAASSGGGSIMLN